MAISVVFFSYPYMKEKSISHTAKEFIVSNNIVFLLTSDNFEIHIIRQFFCLSWI